MAGQIALSCDGAPLDSGRVDLRAGVHTLAIEITEIVAPTRRGPRSAALIFSRP